MTKTEKPKRQYHELKILTDYFYAVNRGEKTFEVRKNDRNFRVGDIIDLKQWENGKYTGNGTLAIITYILNDAEYCKEGYVVFSFKIIQKYTKYEFLEDK